MTMPDVIEILIPGLQGPPGPSGAGGAAHVHVQSSASAEWIVNHNLGVWPTVSVFSTGGVEVFAEVVHASLNQTRIYFTTPRAGTARCV